MEPQYISRTHLDVTHLMPPCDSGHGAMHGDMREVTLLNTSRQNLKPHHISAEIPGRVAAVRLEHYVKMQHFLRQWQTWLDKRVEQTP